MKYELFDFQKDAVCNILKKMRAMRNSYENDGELSALSLTAPTGAGKTVISAAVVEGLFYGNDVFEGDEQSAILWLSDSPSLNEQTMKRFDDATDLLNSTTSMEIIGAEFARSHSRLMPGHIYFLNRQLLSKKGKLTNDIEGGRTFWDVLTNTIGDVDTHLYLFIDEAHRGLGKEGTSDSANKTIYSKLIDGQEGMNPPMPCVVGISATPERFNAAMEGRKNRDMKAPVDVPVSDVRASGLIKDVIELRTPKKSSNTRHQDLTQACIRLSQVSKNWKDYCVKNDIQVIVPLLIVQVEDKVTKETLSELCSQILKVCKWLDRDCFANVFGEHEDIKTRVAEIPYCPPEKVASETSIHVLFAKDAISTGWDCPRAEVIYSRRKRNDPTYIAQLIGRMIRTPLARRIDSFEALNVVSCYLPEYDSETVELVVKKLKEDNIALAENGGIIKNPVDVSWFGKEKHQLEKKLENKKSHEILKPQENSDGNKLHTQENNVQFKKYDEYEYNDNDRDDLGEFEVNIPDISSNIEEALERMPKANEKKIKESFESIITRQARHDKPNIFLNLWDCVDIIMSDIDSTSNKNIIIADDFINNVEAEIMKHPSEFKRSYNEVCNTTVTVKRVDPLTGEEYEDRNELVENDDERLTLYYHKAVSAFAGASDIIKKYINKYINSKNVSEGKAIARISSVAQCFEIVQGLEEWAEKKTLELLDEYGPSRYAIAEENREKWDRIEGSTLPYIEHTISVNASVTRQNMDYDKYPKHIISDSNGWAYFNLNGLEKKIVLTELARPLNVAWYRNQSRNLNASLSIAYKLGDTWENMYPDFIFFQKKNNDEIIRTIVDPHGDWLGDSIAKLKGYVSYLRAHPDMFGSVLVVADEKENNYRYLDLMNSDVQNAIDNFTGNSAKSLFTGNLGRPYKVVEET